MMKFTRLLLVVISFLSVCRETQAQWYQLSEPKGGNCSVVERVGTEIWAGYRNGIYTSVNEGVTWSKHPTLKMATMDIKASGDTVMILRENRVSTFVWNLETITSTDGGNTFGPAAVVETDNSYFYWGHRAIMRLDSAWAVYSNGPTFVSFNTGASWQAMNFPATYQNLSTVQDGRLLVCYEPQQNINKGNYYSANGGVSWTFLDSNYVTGTSYVIDTTIFFSTSFTDTSTHYFIARTSDFGATYDTLALDLLNYPGHLRSFNGKLIYMFYAVPGGPVGFESSDMGDTWNPLSLPTDLVWLEEHSSVLLNNWEWLVLNKGILRYNVTSQVYYPTETGINSRVISQLYENNGALIASADNILMTSYDAGATWLSAPAFVSPAAGVVRKGDTLFASSANISNTFTLCYSYDNGHTWDSIPNLNGTHYKSPACMALYHDKLFIGNNYYPAMSSDWGVTWDSISKFSDINCSTPQFNIWGEQFALCNDNLFLLDSYDDKILKLDTTTWTFKTKFCFSPSGVSSKELKTLGTYIAVSGSYRFYVSADSGETWTAPLRNGLPMNGSSIWAPTSLVEMQGIWFGAVLGNIYYTTDQGDNWQLYPTPVDMPVGNGRMSVALVDLNGTLFAPSYSVWTNTTPLEIITGNIYFDTNNNGIRDVTEIAYAHGLLTSSPNTVTFSADANGDYTFLSVALGDTLLPALPTAFCSSNPGYYITNGPATNVDFGLYFEPGIQDHAIDITNRSIFRPGFTTKIDVTVTNRGTVLTSGQADIELDTLLTFMSSTITPSQINGNIFTFPIDTIQLMEEFHFTIDVVTSVTAVLDTPVNCSAVYYPVTGDTVPANNYATIDEPVTGSYDPNDKTCLTGDYFTPQQLLNQEEMRYLIRFQNTGNFQADNIYIIDTLSQYFDPATFRLISTSHPVTVNHSGTGVVRFNFDNIFLPPMTTDEPGSHGFVKYAIKPRSTVGIGTGIENLAYIYFDFNAPIITNTVTTLVADPPFNVSLPELDNDIRVLSFPNPVSDQLQIRIKGADVSGEYQMELYDFKGMLVAENTFTGSEHSLKVSHLSSGIYTGKIMKQHTNQTLYFRVGVVH